MFGLFKKEDPIVSFWNWFSKNSSKFKKILANPELHLNEILSKLRTIDKGLFVEIAPEHDGMYQLIISANGNMELFSIVENIVKQAPNIQDWSIKAFRQKIKKEKLTSIELTIGDITLRANEMKYSPIKKNDNLEIVVYVNGITEINHHQIAQGSLHILDNILGEYDSVTKITNYYINPMPENANQIDGVFPLIDLADFVDTFFNTQPNKISICAINSNQMDDEELIQDDLHLYVKWDLSNMFADLTLSRDMLGPDSELDQIGAITEVDIEPLYKMTFFWEPKAIQDKLAFITSEEEKAIQLKTIANCNSAIIGNFDLVQSTVLAINEKIANIENLRSHLILDSEDFFDNNRYFNKPKQTYHLSFYSDIKKIIEFLDFAKTLDGDSIYFKYN